MSEEGLENLDEEVEEDLSTDPELAQVLAHMDQLKGKVAVEDLDFLLARMKAKDGEIKELAKVVKRHNKVMMRMQFMAMSVLKDLERKEYKGPAGSIKIKEELQIRMPQTPEQKEQLWKWMRERGLYDKYATVQANSLKALFNLEMDLAAQEQGDDFDPILWSLPGMEPAKFFDHLKFTPSKGA